MDYISEFVKGGVSMHAYMKAVGFSAISSRKEMQKLIEDVIRNSDRRKVVENEEHHLLDVYKRQAPHFVLPQSPPVFVIRAVALLTHTGLPVQYP